MCSIGVKSKGFEARVELDFWLCHVYNLEDEAELDRFIQGKQREIPVFGTDRTVKCDVQKRLAIGISRLGTTQATTIGAYCFALHKLDEK